MENLSKEKLRVSGQSTIEFLMTLTFSFLFLFYFLKMSLNFTRGYVVHYATYMSARSFLVYDNHSLYDTRAQTMGQEAFGWVPLGPVSSRRLASALNGGPRFNGFSDVGGGGNVSPLFKGAYFDYEETLSLTKALGGRDPVTLRSEAFLGREPTRLGCLKRICDMITALAGGCTSLVTLSDNGC